MHIGIRLLRARAYSSMRVDVWNLSIRYGELVLLATAVTVAVVDGNNGAVGVVSSVFDCTAAGGKKVHGR